MTRFAGAVIPWIAIVRLGLVQAALGAIVVLTTSTLNRVMVVGNVLAASVHKDMVDDKGYVVWERIKPVAFCGAPYVNMFAAAHETMEVGLPYDGPEVGAADRSVRSYFEDM